MMNESEFRQAVVLKLVERGVPEEWAQNAVKNIPHTRGTKYLSVGVVAGEFHQDYEEETKK